MTPRTLSLISIVVAVAAVALTLVVRLGGRPEPGAPPPLVVPEPSPTPLRAPLASPTTAPATGGPPRPTVETHRVIQQALNTQDVGTLKTHLADTVQYVISATECCGPLPRAQALKQLVGRLDQGPFDFSPTNPAVQTVRQTATSLEGYVIGMGGGRVLAYRLDERLRLDAIYEADAREFGIPSE